MNLHTYSPGQQERARRSAAIKAANRDAGIVYACTHIGVDAKCLVIPTRFIAWNIEQAAMYVPKKTLDLIDDVLGTRSIRVAIGGTMPRLQVALKEHRKQVKRGFTGYRGSLKVHGKLRRNR